MENIFTAIPDALKGFVAREMTKGQLIAQIEGLKLTAALLQDALDKTNAALADKHVELSAL